MIIIIDCILARILNEGLNTCKYGMRLRKYLKTKELDIDFIPCN